MGVISRIYVLHPGVQSDRKSFMTGNLSALGFPISDVIWHKGNYWKSFNTEADIKRAAYEEGFKFFLDNFPDYESHAKKPERGRITDDQVRFMRHLRVPDDLWNDRMSASDAHDVILEHTRRPIAITWGMCSMLKAISEDTRIALVTYNDMVMTLPFFVLNQCVGQLISWAKEFDPIHKGKIFKVLQIKSGHPHFSEEWKSAINDPKSILRSGFNGNSDFATIISPSGARQLLDEIAKYPWAGFATLFGDLSKSNNSDGFYHTSVVGVVEASKRLVSQL